MVKKAPIAGAALKTPNPSEPTFKISIAKIGNKATAPPKSTATISSVIAPKIAFVLKTNFTPSFKLCITGSPILGFNIGFLGILNKIIKDNITNPKIIHNDQCTPIQCIENPAKAGPRTEAICHVELFQVAAFGYTFFGTIRATNENIVGPKNDRKKPPKNTNA